MKCLHPRTTVRLSSAILTAILPFCLCLGPLSAQTSPDPDGMVARSQRALSAHRALLTASGQLALDQLSRSSDIRLLNVFVDNRRLALTLTLNGSSLLPEACSSAGATSPPASPEWHLAKFRCFLQANQPMFMDDAGSGPSSFDFLVTEYVGPGQLANEVSASFHHYYQGVPVKPGDLRAYYVGGRLTHVNGNLYNPVRFVQRNARPQSGLLAGVAQSTGRSVSAGETYFDAVRNRFIFLAYELGSMNPLVFYVDEETGVILDSRYLGVPGPPSEVIRDLHGFDYPMTPVAFAPSTATSVKSRSVLCQDTGGGSQCDVNGRCNFWLRRDAFLNTYPYTAIDLDRVGAYIVHNDYCFENPWKTIDVPAIEGYAESAYILNYKLAEAFASVEQYFPPPPNAYQLSLNITNNPRPTGTEGTYVGAPFSRISLGQDPPIYNGATNASTMSHEFGHFVHDLYGGGGGIGSSLGEGWANMFPLFGLRYTLLRPRANGRLRTMI